MEHFAFWSIKGTDGTVEDEGKYRQRSKYFDIIDKWKTFSLKLNKKHF